MGIPEVKTWHKHETDSNTIKYLKTNWYAMSKVKESVSAFRHKFDSFMTFRINQLVLEEEEKVDKHGMSCAKLRSNLTKSDFCLNTFHRVIWCVKSVRYGRVNLTLVLNSIRTGLTTRECMFFCFHRLCLGECDKPPLRWDFGWALKYPICPCSMCM